MDISKKSYWILIGIFFLLSIIVYPMSFKEEVWPSSFNISDFPRQVGEWKVTIEQPVSEEFFDETREERLVGVRALNRQYTDKQGNIIWLYIGYFNYQQGPMHHDPHRCYYSQGWTIIEKSLEDVKSSGDVKVNKMFVQKGPVQQIILYWFQMGNEVLTNKLRHQFKLLVRAFLHGRLDGVVISLTSDTERGHIEEIVNYEKDFAKEIIPLLPKYIPE